MTRTILLLLASAATVLVAADNSWDKVKELKSGTEIRIYRSGLVDPLEAKFDEAKELMPKSPDPYLGLARLYTIGARDLDRAEEVLHEAERRGSMTAMRENFTQFRNWTLAHQM